MEPLFEPTSHPVLEADHLKRHAIKDALVELIAEQPPLTRTTAQRHHGWKLEKLLLEKGYIILPATAASVVGSHPDASEFAAHMAVVQKAYQVIRLEEQTTLAKHSANAIRLAISTLCSWLDNATAELEAALSPVPVVSEGAGQGWIRAEDRLPEVGWNTLMSHPVLVFVLGTVPSIRHYEPGAEAWYDGAHGVSEPRRYYSHWMPLPAAPQPQPEAQ